MVPATWAPEPGLRPETRRSLSDHFFPLAVESCFVIGVVALSETRNAKSRVAAELALALAEPRHPRVLLLEGDFQWPAVHHVMGVDTPMADGFSHQLHTRAEAGFDRWVTIECNPTLHVLAEGILRTPGLILSIQFEQGVRSLRSLYDLIVIDGPDTSSEVECRALANVIDGLVLVAPANAGVELERALDLFPDMRFSTIVPV